jgi:hypothetical protein
MFIRVGARRRSNLDRYLGCHLIRVDKHARKQGLENVHILVNWSAMLVLVPLVDTWDLLWLASVARKRARDDVLTRIMMVDGAVDRFVGMHFLVENILVREAVMRGCVGAVRL